MTRRPSTPSRAYDARRVPYIVAQARPGSRTHNGDPAQSRESSVSARRGSATETIFRRLPVRMAQRVGRPCSLEADGFLGE